MGNTQKTERFARKYNARDILFDLKRSLLTLLFRLAALLYMPEGKEIATQLWEETLAELPSAPVQEALQAMSH